MNQRWSQLLTSLIAGEDISREDTAWALDRVMEGAVTPAQLAGFLVALRSKGETTAELTGLADGMLQHARRFTVSGPSVDLVGTGGDRHRTVNISTMAAIIVAATGIRVVKHGNRAASSASGAADVLEELGVRLDLDVDAVAQLAEEVGITFCFAQVFHPSMRHAAVARRELGVATTFNFLGPLTNPAQPTASAIGCADLRVAPLMAGVLAGRRTAGLVFHGQDGLDELAATAPSLVWEVRDGKVTHRVMDWADELGLDRITLDDLRGGSAADNAAVARRVLVGEPGPVRQTVLLNAAAALVALGDDGPVGSSEGTFADRMTRGMSYAAAAVDDGRAKDLLDRWVSATKSR